MNDFYQKLKYVLELIVFKHSIFALPFLFVSLFSSSILVNQTSWFGFKILIFGVLCAVCARNYAMACNRLFDADIDIHNPRTKNRPSVDGRVGKSFVVLFIISNAVLFVLFAWILSTIAFYLSFLVLILLASYSIFKRFSPLAHIVLGLCLGFACIGADIIVSQNVHIYSILLCFGVCFWTAGFDVLYSIMDAEFDKNHGLFSIPSIFGVQTSLFLSAFFHVLAVLFWLLFAYSLNLGNFMYIGILICAVLLMYEQIIVRKNYDKIEKAFFDVNGFVSIVFLLFFLIDIWS